MGLLTIQLTRLMTDDEGELPSKDVPIIKEALKAIEHHDRGESIDTIAEAFDRDERTIQLYLAIGKLPRHTRCLMYDPHDWPSSTEAGAKMHSSMVRIPQHSLSMENAAIIGTILGESSANRDEIHGFAAESIDEEPSVVRERAEQFLDSS